MSATMLSLKSKKQVALATLAVGVLLSTGGAEGLKLQRRFMVLGSGGKNDALTDRLIPAPTGPPKKSRADRLRDNVPSWRSRNRSKTGELAKATDSLLDKGQGYESSSIETDHGGSSGSSSSGSEAQYPEDSEIDIPQNQGTLLESAVPSAPRVANNAAIERARAADRPMPLPLVAASPSPDANRSAPGTARPGSQSGATTGNGVVEAVSTQVPEVRADPFPAPSGAGRYGAMSTGSAELEEDKMLRRAIEASIDSLRREVIDALQKQENMGGLGLSEENANALVQDLDADGLHHLETQIVDGRVSGLVNRNPFSFTVE